MCDPEHHEHHEHHRHHEVVFYMRGGEAKACPNEICARRGDRITFLAVSANFLIAFPDGIFTISIDPEAHFKLQQDKHMDMVVRDDAEYRVYDYAILPGPVIGKVNRKAADPTIIIHNGN